jgi:hypothetical protein
MKIEGKKVKFFGLLCLSIVLLEMKEMKVVNKVEVEMNKVENKRFDPYYLLTFNFPLLISCEDNMEHKSDSIPCGVGYCEDPVSLDCPCCCPIV